MLETCSIQTQNPGETWTEAGEGNKDQKSKDNLQPPGKKDILGHLWDLVS